MRNNEESYEIYKQYRRNRYRYEQEQIIFPIAVIIGGAVLISLWHYILIAIAVIIFIATGVLFLYFFLKKQLKSEQDIIISKADAQDGVKANICVSYNSYVTTFIFNIPPNVRDGQKFVAKNIIFKNRKGKNIKKNVHFKIKIK